MKFALGLGLVLATGFSASSAQLPKECKPNSDNEEAIRDSPSAKVYGQTGHWFEKQGNLKCALPPKLITTSGQRTSVHNSSPPQPPNFISPCSTSPIWLWRTAPLARC